MAARQNIEVTKNRAYKDTLIVTTTGADLVGASVRLRVWARGVPGTIVIDKALPIPDPQLLEATFILTAAETNQLTARTIYTYQVDGTDSGGAISPLLRGRVHVGPEFPY